MHGCHAVGCSNGFRLLLTLSQIIGQESLIRTITNGNVYTGFGKWPTGRC